MKVIIGSLLFIALTATTTCLHANFGDSAAVIIQRYGTPEKTNPGIVPTTAHRSGNYYILVTYRDGHSVQEVFTHVDGQPFTDDEMRTILNQNACGLAWTAVATKVQGQLGWDRLGAGARYNSTTTPPRFALGLTASLPDGRVVLASDPALARGAVSGTLSPNAPVAHPFVHFEADPAGSHSQQDSQWESGWGSYQHSFTTGSAVEVKLRNAGAKPASVRVITVFFAKPSTGGQREVCGVDDRQFELAASMDASFVAVSPQITDTDANYAALGQRYQEGTRFEGWLSVLLDDVSKDIIKSVGSNSGIESLAQNRDSLAALVSAYHGPKTGAK